MPDLCAHNGIGGIQVQLVAFCGIQDARNGEELELWRYIFTDITDF
jgi:hypothetical protein